MQISSRPLKRAPLVAAVALVALTAGWAYVRYHSEVANQQPIAVAPVPEEATGAVSEPFKFSFLDQPRALPELLFVDGEGRRLSLQDFRKRPIVLNIWATWCVPCRKEMPALDRLQSKVGETGILVLPLSIDRQGIPVVQQFYQELRLTALGIFVDQSGKASGDLNIVGVPTTLFIDAEGHEIGRKVGPAEWDTPEVVALIRQHLGPPPSQPKTSP